MSTIVTLPYDPVWTALEWAKKNCPSYITNHAKPMWVGDVNDRRRSAYMSTTDYDINYYFDEEEDAVLFTLRWK